MRIIILRQGPYTAIRSGEMKAQIDALKKELMLQCNEGLYTSGAISREMYEQAKIKIVAKRGCDKEAASR